MLDVLLNKGFPVILTADISEQFLYPVNGLISAKKSKLVFGNAMAVVWAVLDSAAPGGGWL
jgi:hypothetical protein